MKNFGKIFILFALLVSPLVAQGKNVFKLGADSKIITESTSCRPSKWLKVADDSCVCCILKKTPKGKMTDATEVKTLNSCLKYCTGPTLDSISQGLKFQKQKGTSPYKGLVPLILKNFAGLQYIDMTGQDLDRDGNLTETSAPVLLQKAASLNDAMDTLLKDKNFTAEKLGGGGAQTLQLFLIKDEKGPKFILKGMKKPQEEVKNLEIIRNSKLKKYLLDPNKIESTKPALALDVNNFSYMDKKGTQHSVSLINLAAGKDIAKIIMDWTTNPDDKAKKSLANKALYRMGHNIGLIHNEFMMPFGKVFGKTYVHGDMHPYNIFYDDKNDRIIFIDNESFALSIDTPKDPSLDIMKFFGRLVASNLSKKHAYMKKDMSKNEFYDSIVKPFVVGYVEAYPPYNQQKVFAMLYQLMTKQGALKTFLDNEKTILNPIELLASRDLTKKMFKTIARDFPKWTYPGSD